MSDIRPLEQLQTAGLRTTQAICRLLATIRTQNFAVNIKLQSIISFTPLHVTTLKHLH